MILRLEAQATGRLEVPLTAMDNMGGGLGREMGRLVWGCQFEILSDISVGQRVGSWLPVRTPGQRCGSTYQCGSDQHSR